MTKIVIVGEAWGKQEAEERAPFVGPSGRLLHSCLHLAGIARNDVYLTNVFNFQPAPTNDINNVLVGKKLALPGFPPIAPGKYIPAEHAGEIERLFEEIRQHNPNLIIALGNTALSVVMHTSAKISQARGSVVLNREGRKVLATYHPAAVLRDYTLRPILTMDLVKAQRHMHSKEYQRPQRFVWYAPTLAEMEEFEKLHMADPATLTGVDIETKQGTITEIGFAPSPQHAIVVPFYSRGTPDKNYWSSPHEEVLAWKWVKRQCERLTNPVFQNGLYDVNYLWRTMGIIVRNFDNDLMLAHHSQQPEMKKGLGFLGSCYTEEPPWKFMRRAGDKSAKGEEE